MKSNKTTTKKTQKSPKIDYAELNRIAMVLEGISLTLRRSMSAEFNKVANA